MQYSPEALKSFANRLAQVAVSEDGSDLVRMLRASGMLDPFENHAGNASAAAAKQATPDRVGIWIRSKEGETSFVRSTDKLNEWNLWANLPRIESKRGKKRVVLLGESVARGYLYDPQFTPAMALEKSLQFQMGKDAVEVIDLARTNLKWEIQDVARQAALLEPDLVVVFAGNNWNVQLTNLTDIPYLDTTLRTQGAVGLKHSMEERLAHDVSNLVNEIASFYQERNIPLVWIVPEFNLADWREALTNVPLLPDDLNGKWISLLEAAQKALEDDDLSAAYDLASDMVSLDQGLNPAGPYILADCSRRQANFDEARYWLEKARDAAIWDFSKVVSPRAYSVTQNALRTEVLKYSNSVIVDLPQVFKKHLAGGIPDRRLFLDFCHLTVEGIEVAMAEVSRSVLRLWKIDNCQTTLPAQNTIPDRQVKAEGSFLAAVHNAHHHQCPEIVSYHCQQSIRTWPKMAQVMIRFIDIQTRQTPMLMCKSAEEMAALGSPLIPNYLLRKNTQQLDIILLDAAVEALKTVGVDFVDKLTKLRCQEHGISRRERNLLDYYYCSATGQAQELMWVMPRQLEALQRKTHNYYKAYWHLSKFVFIAEPDTPAALTFTCRVPRSTETERIISVCVNGQRVACFEAHPNWRTWDIFVPSSVTREGLNEISVRWPIPSDFSQESHRMQMQDFGDGMPEVFHVFGEIHALIASRVQDIATDVELSETALTHS